MGFCPIHGDLIFGANRFEGPSEFVYQTAMNNVCETGVQLNQRFGLGSMVFAPLKKEDGTVLGLIAAGRLAAEAFSEDELDFIRQLAQHNIDRGTSDEPGDH